MDRRFVEFEWDEGKADFNTTKHGITFEVAATVFSDPNLLTVADVEHSEGEESWFSIGISVTGSLLAVAYLWSDFDPGAVRCG